VGGKVAVNPRGGIESRGTTREPRGGTVDELFEQCAGDAANQVDGARTGLAHKAEARRPVSRRVDDVEGPGRWRRQRRVRDKEGTMNSGHEAERIPQWRDRIRDQNMIYRLLRPRGTALKWRQFEGVFAPDRTAGKAHHLDEV